MKLHVAAALLLPALSLSALPLSAASLSGSDTVAQAAYVKASNTGVTDQFGKAVALSGDTAVVGAPQESSSATGVDGDGSNDDAKLAGAAYVLVRSGSSWSHQAYLKASNSGEFDRFGWSVAISGDTIVVGAPFEDGAATGVDGDQASDAAPAAGAAYVFVRNGSAWSQQAYLKASNTDADDWFGYTVAIDGDTVVVGARNEASAATGIDGDQSDDSAPDAGAAYVFVRNGTQWSQQAYLKTSNSEAGDHIGWGSIAISGDTIALGAFGEDSAIPGNQADNSLINPGAAFVFVRAGTTWSEQAYLKAPDPDQYDNYGLSLALSGDTLIVGVRNDSSASSGVGGDPFDNSLSGSGGAFVYVRNGTTWSQQAFLKASNPGQGDTFGEHVALSGDVAVVGAISEDSGVAGIGGDGSDDSSSASGAAYVFARSGSAWGPVAYVKSSNPDPTDLFYQVAIDGDAMLVGAYGEDSAAVGIDGDQSSNSADSAGAVYAFSLGTLLPSSETSRVGVPPNADVLLPGQTSGPVVGAVWDPVIDHSSFHPAAVADFLAIGVVATNVPTSLGTLLCGLAPPLVVGGVPGTPFALALPANPGYVGVPLFTQGATVEATLAIELTNALDVVLGSY